MKEHSDYASSFQNYLKCTDEKRIFLQSFARYIKDLRIHSLLDIGAGNGDLAIPLSKLADKYVAVEKNGVFVKKLESEGVEVVKADFSKEDINIQGGFELVICSYVIRHDKEFAAFVAKAWRHVSPGGHLLIATHPDSTTEWERFCRKISLENVWSYPDFIALLINYLKALGKVSTEEVGTYIRSEDKDEFFSALAFVYSGGIKEIEESFYNNEAEIKEVIEEDYMKDGAYSFPFTSEFILCSKAKD